MCLQQLSSEKGTKNPATGFISAELTDSSIDPKFGPISLLLERSCSVPYQWETRQAACTAHKHCHRSLQPETGDKGELKLENKGGLSFFSLHTFTQSQLHVASSKLRTTRCFPSIVVLRNKGDKAAPVSAWTVAAPYSRLFLSL